MTKGWKACGTIKFDIQTHLLLIVSRVFLPYNEFFGSCVWLAVAFYIPKASSFMLRIRVILDSSANEHSIMFEGREQYYVVQQI